MKLGFIYAGQGTQYVGMGQSFYENDEDCKNLLDSVKLDFDLKDIMFNSDEKTIRVAFVDQFHISGIIRNGVHRAGDTW